MHRAVNSDANVQLSSPVYSSLSPIISLVRSELYLLRLGFSLEERHQTTAGFCCRFIGRIGFERVGHRFQHVISAITAIVSNWAIKKCVADVLFLSGSWASCFLLHPNGIGQASWCIIQIHSLWVCYESSLDTVTRHKFGCRRQFNSVVFQPLPRHCPTHNILYQQSHKVSK